MDDATKRMAKGLLEAIRAERDGYNFYAMAAQGMKDKKGREMFETLAKEEQEHEQFLEAQYKSMVEQGNPDPNLRLQAKADLSGESPLFSDGIRGRLGEAHHEMSALSIGIRLEQAAMDYYRAQAKDVPDQTVRDFYVQLADWEQGHYYALLRQEELLKEEYWAAAGFHPF